MQKEFEDVLLEVLGKREIAEKIANLLNPFLVPRAAGRGRPKLERTLTPGSTSDSGTKSSDVLEVFAGDIAALRMEVRDMMECVSVRSALSTTLGIFLTLSQFYPDDARLRALVYRFSSTGIPPHTLLSEAKTIVRQVKSILGRKVKVAAFKLYPGSHEVNHYSLQIHYTYVLLCRNDCNWWRIWRLFTGTTMRCHFPMPSSSS